MMPVSRAGEFRELETEEALESGQEPHIFTPLPSTVLTNSERLASLAKILGIQDKRLESQCRLFESHCRIEIT